MDISEYIADGEEQQKMAIENMLANTRVAIPGIVISFDPLKQTADVQPAIKEEVNMGTVQLPPLLDVPVCFPRSGGYCMTLPVQAGDECLVVFCDMCIDGWWQAGGIQNQVEKRRHSLSDAVAILGITSVPHAVGNYANTLQIRNESGEAYLEISDNTVTIKADRVVFQAKNGLEVTTPSSSFNGNVVTSGSFTGPGVTMDEGNVNLQGKLDSGNAVIAGIDFKTHIHSGVTGGEDNTKGPL